jgi:hypothetical protein
MFQAQLQLNGREYEISKSLTWADSQEGDSRISAPVLSLNLVPADAILCPRTEKLREICAILRAEEWLTRKIISTILMNADYADPKNSPCTSVGWMTAYFAVY